MSRAADALAARAARVAARPVGDSSLPVAPRTEPVRITIDLSPVAHQGLLACCRDAAETLAVPKVPAAALIRAVLAELRRDPGLVERVLPDVLDDVTANRRRK